MATHTIHDDTHTHGLADNCPRCDELANNPVFLLDNTNMENLVRRTKEWMHNPSVRPRSNNEHKAMRMVEQHLRIIERLNPYL
jgi:hypothetical protein